MRTPSPPVLWATAAATVLVVAFIVIGGVARGDADDPATDRFPDGIDLRLAPWAVQPDGSPTIDQVSAMPSATFPAGVTHAQALRSLYLAVRSDGALPAGAELSPPLPAEVAVMHGDDGRLRISLLAPFGWVPGERRIRPPSLRVPGDVPPAQLRRIIARINSPTHPLPAEVAVDVPTLSACQVARGTPEGRPPCAD